MNPDAKDKKAASAEDKPRLYFDLANADLIPSCMKADSQDAKSFGPVTDRWDDGFTLWHTQTKISWVLVVVVGLLSVEWLTRKLLRLA